VYAEWEKQEDNGNNTKVGIAVRYMRHRKWYN